MKAITKEVTETRIETLGYEAIDGTKFYNYNCGSEEQAEKECKRYECTAQGVIGARVQRFKLGETNELALFDIGWEDNLIEIFKPRCEEDINDLEMYLEMNMYKGCTSLNNSEKRDKVFKINNEIIIYWNADKDWFSFDTLETLMGKIKDNYYKAIEKENADGQK